MKWALFTLSLIVSNLLCETNSDKRQINEPFTSELRTIDFGDTLRYELGYFGDEEGAKVSQSPRFNLFKDYCSEDREPLIYCYAAKLRFNGNDTVTFTISKDSYRSDSTTNKRLKQLIIQLEK